MRSLFQAGSVEGVGGYEADDTGEMKGCDIAPAGSFTVQAAPVTEPAEAPLDAPVELTPFVVHDLCGFAGFGSLVSEGSGRQAAQGHVGSISTVTAGQLLQSA
ncbi:hypothetical protein [Methylobacterium goesingense]|uniref:Uncharacterized protein n=1 Tax=Methylobacterium goesingense TaxID=243690 RepID=A0ABV2LFD6_9HYPH|nr:hypothetical protein [Methylobacterium goesingense]